MSGLRVVFDARYLNNPSSGIGTYCDNLLRALLRLEPQLRLALITRQRGLAARYDSGRCEDFVFRSQPRSFATLYALSVALRNQHYDVYHSPFNILPGGLRGASVVTIHDLMQLQNPSNIATSRFVQQTAGLFWRTRIRHATRSATQIAAVSEATRDALLEFFPYLKPEGITVTPNGVDEYFFGQPSAPELSAVDGITRGAPFVLCVGNESPHKNHRRAILAFQRAFESESPIRLVLVRRSVRRDPEMIRLLQEPEVARRVIVVDRVELPILRALYRQAKVFFFPSWVEGFGIPILEAMACRTVVVTSDRSAPREVAGEAALGASPFDTDAMAAALRRAVYDDQLRAVLIESGVERARQYPWERCAQQTIEAYRAARDKLKDAQ